MIFNLVSFVPISELDSPLHDAHTTGTVDNIIFNQNC
jgi:hypothetical protein